MFPTDDRDSSRDQAKAALILQRQSRRAWNVGLGVMVAAVAAGLAWHLVRYLAG